MNLEIRSLSLIGLLALLSITSLFIGVTEISFVDIFRLKADALRVLFISRVPRLLSLLIAGTSLSICGLIMQQLSQNRFVSPTTAGTMDSARFGILVTMLVFPSASSLTKMVIAFLFALGGTYIFMQILRRIRFKDAILIPLIGLMFGNIIDSLTTFVAYKYDLIQNLSSWLLGNFALIMKGRYELLYISVPAVALAYAYASRFTIAGMGETFARNLGLEYRQVLSIGLTIVALITAAVVLTAGMIPFLGLVVPNIVSLQRGDHLQNSLGDTAILGAVFILACDILSRLVIFPYEIPISLTVGIIGGILFTILLLRKPAYV